MMKKLSVFIILCILTIGIAANANIQITEKDIIENAKVQISNSQTLDVLTTRTTSDPSTIAFLLGVGIVGFVTFSRMNSKK
jgi:hypothetical protein